MKQRFLFFLTFMLSNYLPLQAQYPVIHRSNEFAVGDSALLYRISGGVLSSFTSGPSGGNVFWDFSGLNFTDSSLQVDTLAFLHPAGTPFYPITLSADYSQSNLCRFKKTNPLDPSNLQYTYYIADDDSLALIGFAEDNSGSEHWEDHCTDVIKQLSFPFTYQDNFVDHYRRYYFDMSGSDGHYITGTNTVTADAYGSLKTPDGTILNNVLRVRTTLTIRDSNVLFGIVNVTRSHYRWYSPLVKGFILSLEMEPNGTAIQSAEYQKQTNIVTSITKMPANTPMLLYPNPGNGEFTIRNAYEDIVSVEVFSTTGQKVHSLVTAPFQKEVNIRLPHITKGVYFVKVLCGNEWITTKVFMQ